MSAPDQNDPNPNAAETRPARPLIALIIEDSEDQGEILSITLKRLKMHAIVEPSGKGALQKYRQVGADLIMLDINLPDMSGWEVLDAIKEIPPDEKPPAVIVLTAYGDQKNRLAGKLRGIDAYLVKPFLPDRITEVVLTVMENRRTGNKTLIEPES